MLVLSRKKEEFVDLRIEVPPSEEPTVVNIAVQVVELRGDKARLGFHAPHEVHIARREINRYFKGGSSVETSGDSPADGVAGKDSGT